MLSLRTISCLIYLATVWLHTPCFAQPPKPPNVLFISIDDLGSQVKCFGDSIAITPNLDRLSQTGVQFDFAYNQIPLCNPSRASVMTGLRPDTLGVYDLDTHFRERHPDITTLPQAFKNQGYWTGRVGKIYHYNVPKSIGTDGADDPPSWQQTINPIGRDKTDEHLVFTADPPHKGGGTLNWLAADGRDEEQTDGMIATEAIQLMKQHRDEPFFIAAGFFRPHRPFIAPKAYFELYPLDQIEVPYAPKNDRKDIPSAAFAHNCPVPHYGLDELTLKKSIQAYYACVSFVDAQIGRLLTALDELGLRENTIVIVWSDHGYHLGEHGGAWQKRTLFEECAAAPLIIRAPGRAGNGQACQRVVEFVDIYPTLIELAGLTYPTEQSQEGASLVPLLDQPTRQWDSSAITQVLRPPDSRFKEPIMGCSIRTEHWRYTEWGEGKHGRELYDHQKDPGEFHNLAHQPSPSHQTIIQMLRKTLYQKSSGKVPTVPFNPKRL